MSDLNGRISLYVNSNSVTERASAVLAIGTSSSFHPFLIPLPLDELIDIDFDENENANKITKFSNYLRIALTTSEFQILLHASRVLGTYSSYTPFPTHFRTIGPNRGNSN